MYSIRSIIYFVFIRCTNEVEEYYINTDENSTCGTGNNSLNENSKKDRKSKKQKRLESSLCKNDNTNVKKHTKSKKRRLSCDDKIDDNYTKKHKTHPNEKEETSGKIPDRLSRSNIEETIHNKVDEASRTDSLQSEEPSRTNCLQQVDTHPMVPKNKRKRKRKHKTDSRTKQNDSSAFVHDKYKVNTGTIRNGSTNLTTEEKSQHQRFEDNDESYVEKNLTPQQRSADMIKETTTNTTSNSYQYDYNGWSSKHISDSNGLLDSTTAIQNTLGNSKFTSSQTSTPASINQNNLSEIPNKNTYSPYGTNKNTKQAQGENTRTIGHINTKRFPHLKCKDVLGGAQVFTRKSIASIPLTSPIAPPADQVPPPVFLNVGVSEADESSTKDKTSCVDDVQVNMNRITIVKNMYYAC